jgi:hypothetical protein
MRHWRVLIWLLCFALAAPLYGQSVIERLITPGPLSTAHARLERNCAACHTSFRQEAQNSRCTACHSGIGGDISSRTHYHGRFVLARTGSCRTCHSEHRGRGVGLIRLDRNGFNHGLTDYPLVGGHARARATCTACHGNGTNYRGITRECVGCHARAEPHRGQLGRACQNCHTPAAWRTVQGFDHARTGFALSGAHRRTTCMTCHAGQRWRGLATTCVSCHARDDAHHGSRGTNCAQCHTTATWGSATFDHASTGFPLTGGHAGAACAGCHGAGNANRHPSRTCIGCHASDDAHNGNNGTNCASCHNTGGWRQTSFDHDRMTQFPLRGAHRTAACAGCHKQPPRVAKPPVTCVGCHAEDDAHEGRNGTDCERCHGPTAWTAVSFNHNTMTRFPLAGKHATARCEACHTQPPRELRLATDCASCHTAHDVHNGRLGTDCARCHEPAGWKTNVRFDHGLTAFPLLGKHASAQCTACHTDKTFTSHGTACADCHVDDHHNGAFGTPAQCRQCHNTVDWKVWNFNHTTATQFPLTGRHEGLICSACHTRPGNPATIERTCNSCHRRDDVHRGGFGEDCERCHTTSGFSNIVMPTRR